jgi:small subunit ribosomal protein S4
MTKIIQAKYKLDRRMGENIWGRPKSPVIRREYGPGQHGQRRRSKLSDFGIQLRAKQKLKGYYGNILEKQFHKLYVEANKIKGDTGENLIGLLESRLDAVVYRSKLVPTVFAARQFVNHGHVKVNGRKCNIGSRRLKAGDIVEVFEKSQAIPMVLEAKDSNEREIPEYINRDGFKVTYVRVPALDDVPYPVIMEPNLVVEFYSR